MGWCGVVIAGVLLVACGPGVSPVPAAPIAAPLPPAPGPGAAPPPHSEPVAEPPPPACAVRTCRELGLTCGGAADDGCGAALDCGACDEGTVLSGERCNPQTGWCWENFPDGATLAAVVAFASDEAWAVGDGGLIQRWNGSAWKAMRSNTEGNLTAVGGSGPADVWAAGDEGLLVHWDGVRWTPTVVGGGSPAISVTGTSPRDVWVLRRQELLHWDGTRWAVQPMLPYARQIHALAPGLLVAAGDSGCQWFRDGRWQDAGCGLWGASDVWASSPSDVWAVAAYRGEDGGRSSGARAHWDGVRWTVEPTDEPLYSVFGFGPRDVWINGSLHYDGRSWTRRATTTVYGPVAGSSGSSLWSVGWQGLWHFDGSQWQAPAGPEPLQLSSIGTTEDGGVWAAGAGGALLVREASGWKRLETHGPSGLAAAFGSSARDLWAWDSPMTALRHWDGEQWRIVTLPEFPGQGWALAKHDVTVVSRKREAEQATLTAWHWDGDAWTPRTVDLGVDLQGLAYTPAEGLWAKGFERPSETPVLWRQDGAGWKKVFAPGWRGHLGQLFATSPGDVWLSGYEEPLGGRTSWVMLHWNGTTFERSGPPDAFPLAGTGPRDVWAGVPRPEAPNRFGLLHFDGERWSPAGLLPISTGLWTATPSGGTYAITWRGAVFSHPAP